MHFHLPKPLHGWRAFVGEVSILVLGVLIALAFGAIVDDFKWRIAVSEARTQLRYEIGLNLALLDDRISEQRCVEKRLNELAVVITRASEVGRLPPLGTIGRADIYTWPTSVWDSQVAAGTLTHFPSSQNAAISRAYRFISFIHQTNESEAAAWLTLNAMVGPGRPVDAASVGRLIEALGVARRSNGSLAFQKQLIKKVLFDGGLGKDFAQLDPRNPPLLSPPSICDPIGKPASNY